VRFERAISDHYGPLHVLRCRRAEGSPFHSITVPSLPFGKSVVRS
jgi:hypothetical protein